MKELTMKKKKGFTLVELLVVIAIIALLMGILMPALARVRMIAYRMVCGTNLSGIGKAINLYSGDSKEEYPMPGISKLCVLAQDGRVRNWTGGGPPPSAGGAYGTAAPPSGNKGTVGSIFYLLIKYEDLSVKQFNCKGDVGVKTFALTLYPATTPPVDDFTKAWDFGTAPGLFNSYSYHSPFALNSTGTQQGYPITSSSNPGAPIAADRNPTCDRNVTYIDSGSGTLGGRYTGTDTAIKTPFDRWNLADDPQPNSYKDPDLLYNSFAHQREGQNVLFNDSHVQFAKQANVGINNDNIWQKWPTGPTPIPVKKEIEVGGKFPVKGAAPNTYSDYASFIPMTYDDALLINEHQDAGAAPK
jgi:prepilin-type N-terminal cleavage/methylation domain-containing protein